MKPFVLLIFCIFAIGGLDRVIAQGDDHGNSCSTATLVGPLSTTLGQLDAGDSDFFQIEVPMPNARLTVNTNGGTDTFGRLFQLVDGVPILLVEDSNAGDGGNFLISEQLESGNYCVEVVGGSSSIEGPYIYQVQADFPDDDHGNSCATGTATLSEETIPGELTVFRDADYFIIDIPEPDARLTVGTSGSTDTFGRLFQLVDGVPILLVEDSNAGDGGNFLISERLEPGTYCAQVVGGSAGVEGAYLLRAELDLPDDDHGNSCMTATSVGNAAITGELSIYRDSDHFLVQIPASGGNLTVSTSGSTDTFGRLFEVVEGIPILLEEDSNGGTGGNFLISRPLNEGTYCAQVIGGSAAVQGDYVFQTMGDFIPAGSCSANNVALSVGEIAFGPVALAQTVFSIPVTLTNISADIQHRLFIDPATLGGMHAADFGVVNDTCAAQVLLPGEACTLRVVFAPLDEGPKAATMLIPCNDLDTPILEIPLSGEALPAAP